VRRQAQLLLAKDSLDMAIEKMREVVKIYRDRFGHPTMMLIQALRLLGKIGFVAGNNEVYNQATDELAEIKLTYLFNAFRYASESLKLSYVRRYPLLESILFSGIVDDSKPGMINSAVEMVLNGKGLAFDAMAAQQAAAMCSEEPYLDSLLDRHIRISDRIAGMVLASKETSAETLSDLFSQKDQIESEISSFCANIDFTKVRERVKVGDIIKSLPDNSVFLDFVKYEHYDYESHYPYGQDSMYAAIVYAPDRQVEVICLGYSNEIERSITKYHEVMADALAGQLKGSNEQFMIDYADVAYELYQRLVVPLPPFVRSTKKIFICADGMMNLLPFETITGDGKKFLIEDHQFVYLTSGRDLLKKKSDSSEKSALVLADPDFTTDPAAFPALATTDLSSIYASRGNSRNPECLASMFAQLPLTRREGSAVADLMSRTGRYNVTYFEAEMAQEGVLKNLGNAPDILHIATHGYFCQQSENAHLSNPLLRSGLILAGANRTIGAMNEENDNGEDGILTAMEVSGLNLIGTDLVVLSACQTGIGDIQSGEGVFGLRRAFQHAGARSIIISMFAVPDESTSELMERFYTNWLSGKSKSAALHDASLSILREHREKQGTAHPIFWGGFVLIGDPE
jgi:CHAT domain-containing protein